MNTTANVKKVSLLFFIALAGTHITASLLLANEYDHDYIHLAYGTLDIPAILACLIYGFTSVKNYLEETNRDSKLFDMVAGILAGIVLIGAIYFNFFASL